MVGCGSSTPRSAGCDTPRSHCPPRALCEDRKRAIVKSVNFSTMSIGISVGRRNAFSFYLSDDSQTVEIVE